MAKLPRRKCKVCREWFHPAYSNVVWCCPEHGAIYALELRARRIRDKHQADKAER
ncbi:recombination protein NinG, partial [Salmonella enterica]|uniref:recombination protein NinG n=1 Tax=Salmonella enterica TaxID=28901 RepID=UPI0008FED6A9